MLADGKFIKFDERGNVKALAAIKATSKEKDLKAKVTGTVKEDVIQVESIQIGQPCVRDSVSARKVIHNLAAGVWNDPQILVHGIIEECADSGGLKSE